MELETVRIHSLERSGWNTKKEEIVHPLGDRSEALGLEQVSKKISDLTPNSARTGEPKRVLGIEGKGVCTQSNYEPRPLGGV